MCCKPVPGVFMRRKSVSGLTLRCKAVLGLYAALQTRSGTEKLCAAEGVQQGCLQMLAWAFIISRDGFGVFLQRMLVLALGAERRAQARSPRPEVAKERCSSI